MGVDMKRHFLATALISCVLVLAPAAAHAGSDDPTPYTVTASGVQLPSGVTFEAHGHVNIRISTPAGERQVNMHFDPNNGHPGAEFIGANFFPYTLTSGECVVWMQLSLYDEHFGEGGQDPVCKPDPETTPEPTDPPLPTATPDPQSTKTPTEVPTLAETGLSPLSSWALIVALLLMVAGGSLAAYRKQKEANNE